MGSGLMDLIVGSFMINVPTIYRQMPQFEKTFDLIAGL
jgi:hypothetical protein